LGKDNPIPTQTPGLVFESYAPTRKVYIPVDKQRMLQNGLITPQDSALDKISFNLQGNYLIKDDLAVLDIIANNINDRPIYFAVTCRPEKLQGLDNFTQLEGLALRLVPVRTEGEGRSFGLIGSGRVATDKVFDRVMNKFRWGNFDKEKTFINRSYTPSVQTTQFAILRTALDLQKKGDKDRVVQLLEKNFESFPNFNFPYDAQTMFFIEPMIQMGAYDKAKKHVQILAQNLEQNFRLYQSLDPVELQSGSFAQDFMRDAQTHQQLLFLVEKQGDTAFLAELEKMFAPYKALMPKMGPQQMLQN
jgi:hypothetical protein